MDTPAPTLHIQLLGGLSLSRTMPPPPSLPTRRQHALIAYLACMPGSHSRETLGTLLWPDKPYDRTLNSLRTLLVGVRRALGPHLLITPQSVAWNRAAPFSLDVTELAEAVAAARAEQASQEQPGAAAVARLESAVALYRGEFLAGFYVRGAYLFEEWAAVERERSHQNVVAGLHLLRGYYEAAGRWAAGLAHSARLLELDPLDEAAHRGHMRLLAHDGQRSAALRQFGLCRSQLAAELGAEPSLETVALYERLRDAPATLASASLRGFPAPLTTFVGREAEQARLVAWLREPSCRLLTLVGQGGIGKTRLSIRVARSLEGVFRDGGAFVPLEGEHDPAALPVAIAASLGIAQEERGEPEAQLLAALRDREMLLVLDNLEHLLEGMPFLSRLLAHAPALKVLATSREVLGVRGERVQMLTGLDYPDATCGTEDGGEYSAVQLFQHLALPTLAERRTLPDAVQEMGRICRLVGGVPLAIEMAAAWLRSHELRTIRHKLEATLDLLVARERDVPERQRSMRAIFEQSWQLLDPAERRVLAALAVFPTHFTDRAARAVAEADEATLAWLVDKSWLRHVGERRYALHPLQRQFALEKLALQPGPHDEAMVRTRHSTFYLEWVRQHEPALFDRRVTESIAALEVEVEHVQQAWQWAISRGEWALVAAGMGGLAAFYEWKYLLRPGHYVFSAAATELGAALARAPDPTWQLLLSELWTIEGTFLWLRGELSQAKTVVQEAIDLTLPSGEGSKVAQVRAHLTEGEILWRMEKRSEADHAFRLAFALLTDGIGASDGQTELFQRLLARAQKLMGMALARRGAFDEASQHLEAAHRYYQRVGYPTGMLETANALAALLAYRGEVEQARAHWQEVVRLAQSCGHRRTQAAATHNLGLLHIRTEEYIVASGYLMRTVELLEEEGTHPRRAMSLLQAGIVWYRLGHFRKSVGLLEEAGICFGDGPTPVAAIGLLYLALCSHHLGDGALADERLRAAHYRLEQQGTPMEQALGWLARGYVAVARGALGEGRGAYERARALRRDSVEDARGEPQPPLEALAGLALVALQQGKRETAGRFVEEILHYLPLLEGGSLPRAPFKSTPAYMIHPMQPYRIAARVLDALGDPRAPRVLATERHKLAALAASLGDEQARCFWGHVKRADVPLVR